MNAIYEQKEDDDSINCEILAGDLEQTRKKLPELFSKQK